jgi:Co/Zn/Cd efflux system component
MGVSYVWHRPTPDRPDERLESLAWEARPARRSSQPTKHSHSAAGRHADRLAGAIAVSALVLVVELIAGIVGNSLARLADAGHLFADVSGLGLSLVAVWVAARRA